MSSTSKGNKFEDEFYNYLVDQQSRGELVFDAHPPENCRIYKKKKYYHPLREADVEFDIVIEVTRKGRENPYLFIVFECKNYNGHVPEIYVSEFSKKLEIVFHNAAKGVMVVSSKLQSGADRYARNSKIGIIKYDDGGFETIVDRRGRSCLENKYIEKQLFAGATHCKSLRFSSYYDGHYFSSLRSFLENIASKFFKSDEAENEGRLLSIPYVPIEHIKSTAEEILDKIGYVSGPVDLRKACSLLSIDLKFTHKDVRDVDGTKILGTANFDRNLIIINEHINRNRENFTIGHEIGHFCMRHELYLHSENMIERDLLINSEDENTFNLERLEFQANAFSSHLLLPDEAFKNKTADYRRIFDIRDRGHGYIFVDDQPCNYIPYHQILLQLSSDFEVSKKAVEIKLHKLGMLADNRRRTEVFSLLPTFDAY